MFDTLTTDELYALAAKLCNAGTRICATSHPVHALLMASVEAGDISTDSAEWAALEATIDRITDTAFEAYDLMAEVDATAAKVHADA